jgi:hypothetical protein
MAEALALLAPVHPAGVVDIENDLERLASEYKSEEESWRRAPTRKRVRTMLDQADRDLSRAADILDNLPALLAQLMFCDPQAHSRALAVVDATARSARCLRTWIDERAPKGGRGRLGHLLGPPPRVQLAIRAAMVLDDCRPGAVSTCPTGPLYELTRLLLEMAGEAEPTRGLADVIRAAVAGHHSPRENCAIVRSDLPIALRGKRKRSSARRPGTE